MNSALVQCMYMEVFMMNVVMDTAKVTTNGQVTIPADFRKLLNLKPGNKVLFFQRENGDVVIENASVFAEKNAQASSVRAS